MAATGDIGAIAVETISTGELSAGIATTVVEPAPQTTRAHFVSAIAAAAVSTAVSTAVTATVAAASAAASAESAATSAAAARIEEAIPSTGPQSSPPLPTSTIKDGHSQNNGGGNKEPVGHADILVAEPQSERDTRTGDDQLDADDPSLRPTNNDTKSADRELDQETTGRGGDIEPRGFESPSRQITPEGHDIAITTSGDNLFGAHQTAAVGLVAKSDGRTTEGGEAKQKGGGGRIVYSAGPDDGATVWLSGKREAAMIQVWVWRTACLFSTALYDKYAHLW